MVKNKCEAHFHLVCLYFLKWNQRGKGDEAKGYKEQEKSICNSLKVIRNAGRYRGKAGK